MRNLFILIGFSLILVKPLYAAQPDIEAGKTKASQVCIACHGADGLGINTTYPKLAGQYPDYLEQALNAYLDGSRTNPIMKGMVNGLTAEDVKNLSAYYASLPAGISTLHK